MDEEKKAKMIATAENIEAIKEFFNEWWTVEQLYETAAKACTTLMYIESKIKLCEDDEKDLRDLMNQHMMLIEHMKPFAARKEDEV